MVALAALVALAGCLGSDDGDADDDVPDDVPTNDDRQPLPEPIEASELVVGGQDLTSPTLMGPCENEASSCYAYPFEALGDVLVDASLTWSLDNNDFDLYLFEDGSEVASATNPAPQTSEVLSAAVDPGSYEVVVVAWLVGQDTFELSVTFDHA